MSRSPRASVIIISVAVVLILGAVVAATAYRQVGWHESSGLTQAHWVDESQCQQCHQAVYDAWQGSHHALAMQPPSPATVRGDFNNTHFRGDTQSTTFFRKNGAYWIRTTDKGGEPHEYKVAYTFGWAPLQQYLLETGDGRLQAYNIAWDTRKQLWFDLNADDRVVPGDPLHWRQPSHNANFMCIDCHVSDYNRNYSADDNSFTSHWQAPGVGCQSCHGPASKHVALARRGNLDAGPPGAGFEQSLTDAARSREVETCARCHSRRTPLGDGFERELSLRDNYRVTGLDSGLYEVDGTILAEVFEYGAFAQSRMAAAGVVCSDCHEPHGGSLRAEGNTVCMQCHAPGGQPPRAAIDALNMPTGHFDSPSHHHHPEGSAGAQCASCHMPGRLYMSVDLRHDHGFTTPNPAQAQALGHDDACLGCHQDVDANDVIAQFRLWYPQAFARDRGFAAAQFKARQGKPGAAAAIFEQLARTDLPALQRAALLGYLPSYPSDRASKAVIAAGHSTSPAIRQAAVSLIPAMFAPQDAASLLGPLLQDKVKSVRIAAAWQLVQLGRHETPPAWVAEYESVQQTLLSRATSHVNLASLYRVTGQESKVASQLRTALQLNPNFVPAIIMLAQWLEQSTGATEQARALLEKSIVQHPDDARLRQALGLFLIRAGDYRTALKSLKHAYSLAPENASYAYVLAIALRDTGRSTQASELLRRQVATDPADRPSRLLLLRWLSRDPGKHQTEIRALFAELRQQNPWDPVLPRAVTAASEE